MRPMGSMTAMPAAFPPRLQAIGTADAPYRPMLELAALPEGSMQRVTVGELDLLLAHTERGIFATDDRCPHMSAPLSIGDLDGCIVACPLHEGRFDLVQRRHRPDADDRRPRRRRRAPTRPGRPPAGTRRSTRPARRPRRDG